MPLTLDCFAAKAAPNNQVKAVQTALNKEGNIIEVDGRMGKQTRAALVKLQKAHGLPANGKAEDATRKKSGVK
jgi:peptidoglycan hydrolase-like protein with peptidoglycan-binding domain